MIINHNMNAMNAHRNMMSNVSNAGKSQEKLSSGLRINRAGDDAAGLAISEKMRAQIRGLDQASRNASDGISMIQTAEGALNETQSILQRTRELAVQSATGTNTLDERRDIQKEMNQLLEEVDSISDKTEFNTKKLLNGNLVSKEDNAKLNVVNAKFVSKNVTAALAADVKFTLNGTSISVTSGTKGNVNEIAANIQSQLGKAGITDIAVTANKNRLEITALDGKSLKIEKTGTSDISKLGLNEGVTNPGEGAQIKSANITGAAKLDFSSTKLEFTLNGTQVKLTGAAAAYNGVSDIATKLQEQLEANGNNSIKVTSENDALVFTTSKGENLTIGDQTSGNLRDIGIMATRMQAPKSVEGAADIHVGANSNQSLSVDIGRMATDSLGSKTNVYTDATVRGKNVTAAVDASSTNIQFKVDDVQIKLTGNYGTAGSIQSDIAYDIQKQLQLKGVNDIEVTVNGSALNIANKSGKSISLTETESGNLTKIGLNAGTTDRVSGNQLQSVNFTASTAEAVTFTVNNFNIKLTSAAGTFKNMSDVASAMNNALKAQTGTEDIVVEAAQQGIKITSKSGADVVIGKSTTGKLSDYGLQEGTFKGAQGKGSIADLKITDVDNATKGGVLTVDDANSAITNIQAALKQVSSARSKLGAFQNRLEHTINNLNTSSENLQSSESRIRDVDMASEMLAFSKNNILSQASQAMLAQAKQQPEQVLQLLR